MGTESGEEGEKNLEESLINSKKWGILSSREVQMREFSW